MSMWVLVTNAGSGASGNLVRSLRAGCAGLTIVGCHDDQFILKNSTADRNYLVPPLAHPIARSEISTTPGSQTVFAVDLKEDSSQIPRVTGINAGRFTSRTNLLDLTGKHNMTGVYLQLARGEAVDLHEEYEGTEYHYMLRDVDAVPRVFHADEFFDGVEAARS